jgi:hypothetical protein
MMRCALIPRTATLIAWQPRRERPRVTSRSATRSASEGRSAPMMQAFPTLTANRSGRDTLLIGSLPDQCALYGVIHELEALGLQLLEIRSLPISDSGPESSERCDAGSSGRGRG